MKSIRTYLLLALLSIITLVTFVSLLHGYQSSIAKAQQLFDIRLHNIAEIIANANQNTQPRVATTFEQSTTVFFQIWSDDLTLLARSINAPNQLLFNVDIAINYKDVNFNGYRWRTFTLRDQSLNRWVITGERADIRYSLAETVVTASIIPIVLAIPIASFIIWVAIGLGLKPLKELTGQLNNKQADDLSPVEMKDTPEELTQLVITTNALLKRLNAAFMREQQFSADAAHELRTPISALKVQIHNLQKSEHIDDSDLQALADGIERMGHVIEQILSLYRHSPDQAIFKQTEIDFCAIVQDIIASGYEQIASKEQQISMTGSDSCLMKGNQFALETLVQNLVTNACKYTPEKGEIMIDVKQTTPGIRLTVEDSGSGIHENEHKRVFERFYRINGDRHDSGTRGCGLGLAIVQHIVTLHGAQIVLDRSTRLNGLRVVIDFPQHEEVNND
ncbi:MAG: sensor histidine kinase [Gammaproteobacteria bacterium]|nr:MAG: sensor histidine kinase [Gammaproteobacteria bacterium]